MKYGRLVLLALQLGTYVSPLHVFVSGRKVRRAELSGAEGWICAHVYRLKLPYLSTKIATASKIGVNILVERRIRAN